MSGSGIISGNFYSHPNNNSGYDPSRDDTGRPPWSKHRIDEGSPYLNGEERNKPYVYHKGEIIWLEQGRGGSTFNFATGNRNTPCIFRMMNNLNEVLGHVYLKVSGIDPTSNFPSQGTNRNDLQQRLNKQTIEIDTHIEQDRQSIRKRKY